MLMSLIFFLKKNIKQIFEGLTLKLLTLFSNSLKHMFCMYVLQFLVTYWAAVAPR